MRRGVPKKDGSGKGYRFNKGRGGCSSTELTGKGRGWRHEPDRHGLASKGIRTTARGKRWNRFKKQVGMVAKDLGRANLYKDDLDFFSIAKENEESQMVFAVEGKLKEMGLWENSYNTILEYRDDVAKDSDYDFVYRFVVKDRFQFGNQMVEEREPKIRGWIGVNVDSNNIVEDAVFEISGLKSLEKRNELIDYLEKRSDIYDK